LLVVRPAGATVRLLVTARAAVVGPTLLVLWSAGAPVRLLVVAARAAIVGVTLRVLRSARAAVCLLIVAARATIIRASLRVLWSTRATVRLLVIAARAAIIRASLRVLPVIAARTAILATWTATLLVAAWLLVAWALIALPLPALALALPALALALPALALPALALTALSLAALSLALLLLPRRALLLGLGWPRGERDALTLIVDLEDAHGQLLADLDDLGWILDELLGELADVDEPIVVDADVDEGAERGDVRDDALEHHAGLEVLHRRDVVAEFRRRELGAWITTWLAELGGDVAERWLADVVLDVLREIDLVDEVLITDQIGEADAEILGHLLDERIALGVNGRAVERVRRTVDAQESGRLLECFGSEARNILELTA
jgi:hypothetical protein